MPCQPPPPCGADPVQGISRPARPPPRGPLRATAGLTAVGMLLAADGWPYEARTASKMRFFGQLRLMSACRYGRLLRIIFSIVSIEART